MTVNDLMVGDWVYVKDYPTIKNIQRIRPEHFVRSLVDIEPIPLTPEILEKNGFRNMYGKSNAYVNSESEASYVCFSIGDYDYTSLWGGSDQDYVWITVKYVHQFQHALRLCGITREIII